MESALFDARNEIVNSLISDVFYLIPSLDTFYCIPENWLIEWLRERTEHLDIVLFSAHHSVVFYFRCSVYWWKGSVRF